MRPTLVLLLLATTHCTVETVTTEIQVRDASHAALVRTDVLGSHVIPFPADGTITLVAPASAVVSTAAPATVARWCTMSSREPRGQLRKYEVVENPKCVDAPTPGSIGYALDTDWGNVRIVEHHRPDRAGAWAIIGLSTILYGGLASAVFLAPHIEGGPAVRTALGVTVAGIGGAFDAAVLPTLFAGDEDLLIHDFGQAEVPHRALLSHR